MASPSCNSPQVTAQADATARGIVMGLPPRFRASAIVRLEHGVPIILVSIAAPTASVSSFVEDWYVEVGHAVCVLPVGRLPIGVSWAERLRSSSAA